MVQPFGLYPHEGMQAHSRCSGPRGGGEYIGDLELPLGGVNGYEGVRAQGKKFQGYDHGEKIYTASFPTPKEAAIARAQEKEDKALGMVSAKLT